MPPPGETATAPPTAPQAADEAPGTAIIIGVGPGLGSALCRRFAAAGHAVSAAARGGDITATVTAGINRSGGRAKAYRLDATDEDAVIGLFADAEGEFGPADVVVYNPGVRHRAAITEMKAADFERVWRVSCLGAMFAGREAARRMTPRGRGSILFTGGVSSRRADAELAAFAMGKFAMRAVAESMARELAPKGIHVAHMIIESGIDNERTRKMRPEMALDDGLASTDALAEAYYQVHIQHRSTWSYEVELRAWREKF